MNEREESNTVDAVEMIAESMIAESMVATVDEDEATREAVVQMQSQMAALHTRVEALSERLTALEQAAAHRVEASAETHARKTVPAGVSTMLAKHGLADMQPDTMQAGSAVARVDAALTALPVEQRIAVKAELLRAGLL